MVGSQGGAGASSGPRQVRDVHVDVHVVVPNWNGADLLGQALASLRAQSYPATVVVVDNGSHDGSVDLVRREHPDVLLVELPVNTGFAGGVNAGIALALERGAGAVAAFNNDAVADPDWLAHLVDVLEDDPATGIVTGRITRFDGTHLDSTGEFYSTCGQPFARGRNEPVDGRYETPEPVFGASGCASLYRTSMLREIGVFDERFFAYYEDVDLSFRAQLAGWRVAYQPAALVRHHVSATSGQLGSFTRYHARKNFLLLYLKNMPGPLFWRYLRHFAPEAARQAVVGVVRAGDAVYLRAVLRVLRDLPGVLRDRRRIQQGRRVSVEYVDRWLVKGRPPPVPALER
jgi:GT2 family glycosyltransferase